MKASLRTVAILVLLGFLLVPGLSLARTAPAHHPAPGIRPGRYYAVDYPSGRMYRLARCLSVLAAAQFGAAEGYRRVLNRPQC